MVDYRPLLPAGTRIRRARAFRLYAADGGRYTDWWQGDGAAALGHRQPGLGRLIKAEVDRGLVGSVPTAWDARLERWLARLADRSPWASLVLAGASGAIGASGSEAAESPVPRWEPLGENPEREGSHTAGNGSSTARTGTAALVLPTGGHPAPHLWPAVAATAASALLRYLDSDEWRLRCELAASLALPPGWSRRGALLYCESAGTMDRERWEGVRTGALSRGMILPATATVPIRVPGELGRVELDAWRGVVDDWPI